MRAMIPAILTATSAAAAQPVLVWLDMDAARPGFQSTVHMPPGTTTVEGVGVYIWDPVGGRSVLSIGFIGGLDRGISLGHTPGFGQAGFVTGLTAHVGTPVNPGNSGVVFPPHQPGFAGPEIQYLELGAAAPAPIATSPTSPVFTVDVHLSSTASGSMYFYLLDLVTVWMGGSGGAFTPDANHILTTGGDARPDSTLALAGLDPDIPQPVPPAAFEVDYLDHGSIRIGGCYANCDSSTVPPVLNVADFTCFLSLFASGHLYTNCDGSTALPALNVADFTCFLQQFAAGCP